ncbi:MAG: hypothetical protein FJ398_14360 [Verrucomicrobia bacterium]|nr:hypothetical protein [Verrucomicrobiota bacterium]
MAVADHALSWSAQGGDYLRRGEWLAGVGYRYQYSDHLFHGTTDLGHTDGNPSFKNRAIHFIDLHATYMATKRLSLSLTLPFKYADSTSSYEHDFVHFHTMHAGGLGDIRLAAGFWLLDPAKQREEDRKHRNISLGLGVKFPTGDYQATDTSYRGTGPIQWPVHPSLQLGTGGWGIVLQMDAFHEVFRNGFVYASGSYTIEPRNVNGVPVIEYPGVQSVPDSYVGTIGLSYMIWPKQGLSLSLGGRIEGLPVHDLLGGSEGYRGAGYVISIEPGLAWSRGRNTFTMSAPVALERNRQATVAERRAGWQGYAAAFADFLIQASYSRRF